MTAVLAHAAECVDVRKDYRVERVVSTALQEVTKAFPAGRLTVVAGPSGCGKSTLLRLLACIDRPTTGSVVVDGRAVGGASTRRRRRLRRTRLGYLFPDPIENLVEYLTVAGQLRLAAQLRGRQIADDEIERTLQRFGLAHRLDHHPQQLSGGEQQRVSIACALVGAPLLVVGDEPTAELDSVAADRVLDSVQLLCSTGTAFVIASHDPRVIERADHLLRLEHGRTVESW
ncbi:ATP-binding cassette domain-containing protein [Jatrophihabitans sp.]|uniref:ABC transporter ATP-binding protein n=1 Tax=Jatrophihabitans sp. TaxID=1932789 RepID=UPI0030C6E075|nr:transporter, ATP-binding protein [Jatrophihabitans sp.]